MKIKFTEWILPTIIATSMFLISIFLKAFIFMQLWEWFVYPLGVVKITIFQAIGLICLIYLCKNKVVNNKTESNLKETVEQWLANNLGCVVALFIGWLVY